MAHGELAEASAQSFIEEVRCDDPELASYLRVEERELGAFSLGSVSYPPVQPVALPVA